MKPAAIRRARRVTPGERIDGAVSDAPHAENGERLEQAAPVPARGQDAQHADHENAHLNAEQDRQAEQRGAQPEGSARGARSQQEAHGPDRCDRRGILAHGAVRKVDRGRRQGPDRRAGSGGFLGCSPAPGEPVDPQGRAERHRDEHEANDWKVDVRAVAAERRGRPHQSGDDTRERPVPRAIDELPRDEPVSEDEPVRRLERLMDLVRPVDAFVGEGHVKCGNRGRLSVRARKSADRFRTAATSPRKLPQMSDAFSCHPIRFER